MSPSRSDRPSPARDMLRGFSAVVAMLGCAGLAHAYTAAGDRIFPATIVLPQIGPSDEAYVTTSTLPQQDGQGGNGRDSTVSVTLDKTLTDQLSLTVTGAYSAIEADGATTRTGWQNLDASLQYLVLVDADREFLFSVGVDQTVGGTGAARVGAAAQGTTTPSIYIGKGLGDFDIGLLRPLAIAGFAGTQIADRGSQPITWQTGFAVEYSLPYLESKVTSLDLPDMLRATTLICEFAFSNPAGAAHGAEPTALIAPGFNMAGQGWDIGVEALIPATRSTGTGLGVIAQLHLSLDYLAPNSIGRPMF